MIREKLIAEGLGEDSAFRWRGREVARIEGLSDGVFGFAVTLLVVSLEVPRTFTELQGMMRGFLAFAICFAMLILVWHVQYSFFRRYGLNDTTTIVLNAALLFVVLFYVYPLKFVWTLLVNMVLGFDTRVRLPTGDLVYPVQVHQIGTMMLVFGIGYVAVFAVFTLLYIHAYRKRDVLELTRYEVLETRIEIESLLLNVLIGLISMPIALFGGRYAGISGFCYMFVGPVLAIHGSIGNKRKKKFSAVSYEPSGVSR